MFDPNKNYRYATGAGNDMTLRDYFAAAVLPAVYAQHHDESDEDVALIAYNIALHMMERRKHG